jgi:Universal stress protein family
MARDKLERLSHEVDMLVLGSRGYGPVRRTLLDSTSDWLVHHAACPVFVIPRGAARRTQTAEPTAAVDDGLTSLGHRRQAPGSRPARGDHRRPWRWRMGDGQASARS